MKIIRGFSQQWKIEKNNTGFQSTACIFSQQHKISVNWTFFVVDSIICRTTTHSFSQPNHTFKKQLEFLVGRGMELTTGNPIEGNGLVVFCHNFARSRNHRKVPTRGRGVGVRTRGWFLPATLFLDALLVPCCDDTHSWPLVLFQNKGPKHEWVEKIKKRTTLRIPTWSPTVVLTEPEHA